MGLGFIVQLQGLVVGFGVRVGFKAGFGSRVLLQDLVTGSCFRARF
jgi:hypothetical protein